MNIGSKVKFLVGCASSDLSFDEGQIVEVTKRNVTFVESALRGGSAVLIPTEADAVKEIKIEVQPKPTTFVPAFQDEIAKQPEEVQPENADILSDVRPRTRGSKRGSKPA